MKRRDMLKNVRDNWFDFDGGPVPQHPKGGFKIKAPFILCKAQDPRRNSNDRETSAWTQRSGVIQPPIQDHDCHEMALQSACTAEF